MAPKIIDKDPQDAKIYSFYHQLISIKMYSLSAFGLRNSDGDSSIRKRLGFQSKSRRRHSVKDSLRLFLFFTFLVLLLLPWHLGIPCIWSLGSIRLFLSTVLFSQRVLYWVPGLPSRANDTQNVRAPERSRE